MKLILPKKLNRFVIDKHFIRWLLPLIKYKILKDINNPQIKHFNQLVSESNLLDTYKNNNIEFDARRIILMSINNLRYTEHKDVFIIEIDNNKKVPGYSITLENLCKIINFGTLDIKGFPIYTNAFNHIVVNLKAYYGKYYYSSSLWR